MWGNFSRNGEQGESPLLEDAQHPDEGEIPPLRRALPRISAELARACRDDRQVAVAVFSLAPVEDGVAVAGGAGASDGRLPAPVFASVARLVMREADVVSCDLDERGCIVVMPGFGWEEARLSVSRMRRLCADRLGRPVLAGIGLFPRDAWTLLDLVDVARRHARPADDGMPANERGRRR